MEFNSTAREEMIQWLCDIEQRYPVETWRIDGIYFWNYLRNKLQFELA